MSKESEAKAMYGTLCQTLDNIKWRYGKEDDKLVIHTSAIGEDLTIQLFMRVDSERQVMFLKSPMPYQIPESKRETVATAVTVANFAMLNGSFEMDMANGYLAFKIVVPFMKSLISENVCHYMIMLGCRMTDRFNDKFKALIDDRLTLDEFKTFVSTAAL